MRGFGRVTAAARCCPAFEEQRQYFRAWSRPGERVSLAAQRHLFRDRWAAVLTELAAASRQAGALRVVVITLPYLWSSQF